MIPLQFKGSCGLHPMPEKKRLGQFFTPRSVARSLIDWVVRSPSDLILDPACGDGEFLSLHERSIGIELSPEISDRARSRLKGINVINADFFEWATQTENRFDAVTGNPPFIRYQSFTKERRDLALRLAKRQEAIFSGLTSSWAPFLVVAASMLKPGGRLAFVVPAEIGHATYSIPLIEFLTANFSFVQVIAIREKMFPQLSEDAWLVYADEYRGKTSEVALSIVSSFYESQIPPRPKKMVSIKEWRRAGGRLRKFLLPSDVLAHYESLGPKEGVVTLGSLGRIGIGYVTGGNSFFHLRPSEAKRLGFPSEYLRVTVRNAQQLRDGKVDLETVRKWLSEDREVFLIDLGKADSLPPEVQTYLDSPEARRVRTAFKCRTRNPWYVVPHVVVPDAFLTYMNGTDPALIPNEARCVCTNSLLAVQLTDGVGSDAIARAWTHPLARLSQELEGHPLGGGMLKLEPGEAARVKLPIRRASAFDTGNLRDAVRLMRAWRHYHNG
jgi:SAM-dependent methyltransferase